MLITVMVLTAVLTTAAYADTDVTEPIPDLEPEQTDPPAVPDSAPEAPGTPQEEEQQGGLPLTKEQRVKVEENMGLVGKVTGDCVHTLDKSCIYNL